MFPRKGSAQNRAPRQLTTLTTDWQRASHSVSDHRKPVSMQGSRPRLGAEGWGVKGAKEQPWVFGPILAACLSFHGLSRLTIFHQPCTGYSGMFLRSSPSIGQGTQAPNQHYVPQASGPRPAGPKTSLHEGTTNERGPQTCGHCQVLGHGHSVCICKGLNTLPTTLSLSLKRTASDLEQSRLTPHLPALGCA